MLMSGKKQDIEKYICIPDSGELRENPRIFPIRITGMKQ